MSICLVQKVHNKFPFVSPECGHPASYQKTLPLKGTTPPSSYARPLQSQHISTRWSRWCKTCKTPPDMIKKQQKPTDSCRSCIFWHLKTSVSSTNKHISGQEVFLRMVEGKRCIWMYIMPFLSFARHNHTPDRISPLWKDEYLSLLLKLLDLFKDEPAKNSNIRWSLLYTPPKWFFWPAGCQFHCQEEACIYLD